jgi:aconitate hydratase
MTADASPVELARRVYAGLAERHAKARKLFGRPLTLAEKVLVAHLVDLSALKSPPMRKKENHEFAPDRVAMQDATAQMAILQFMQSGRKAVAAPSTVHCDHLILARRGAGQDLQDAEVSNKEVYDFLATAAAKYGMGFWKPGAGIIHQVVLENYAFPGGMMIGTDSHTPNAGGLGMVAIGVGGADAVDVMVGMPFDLLWPGVIGVKLTGKLSGWAAPKDVILKLMGILTVKGGTNSIVEFFGEGCESISATGKATICNMGAEHGATTSIFPYDHKMAEYLAATGRAEIAVLADERVAELRADPEVVVDPAMFYDRVVEIDLSTLEPQVVGPHTPDLARPVSQMKHDVQKNGYPDELTFALIGSCTNSSYEDMDRATAVAKQAAKLGLKVKVPLLVSPGSDMIDQTIHRDGQMAALQAIGADVLANACGPCIGMWKREDAAAGKVNSIVNSYNRNFPARNDGHANTQSFITSPDLVVAMALAGRLSFDPVHDELSGPNGKSVKLSPPTGDELPRNGFASGFSGFQPPAADPSAVEVAIDPKSERLQKLAPFARWDGKDFTNLPVLYQAAGKCTTDHISQAGPWLKFRGHLDKISDNLLLGAVSRFTRKAGDALNVVTGQRGTPAAVGRDYKARGLGFVIVGDENYGEGSSREHAAMEPRWLGGRAVIARSFARIHETNLKKQGMLPLTFANPADYDLVREDDRVSILGLVELAPGREVDVVLHHADGTESRIKAKHSMTEKQLDWWRAGGALNLMGSRG